MLPKNLFYSVFLILVVLGIITNVEGQDIKYPKDYFISPLTSPYSFTSSFGELRPNHFHAGLDMKTNAIFGHPVVAIADGYVSRVNISGDGYGRMIFVDHPNGYTSVYAHLEAYSKRIDQLVKKEQRLKESYEIDKRFDKSQLPVKKGDTIGFAGNTGASAGPHLHFEIRDTKSEWLVNPQLFGYQSTDNIPPFIQRIKFYPMDQNTVIQVISQGKKGLVIKNYQEPFEIGVIGSNGKYSLAGVKSIKVKGTIGIAVETFDKMDRSGFTYGVYTINLSANKNLVYQQKLDALNFHDIRYINAHVDYKDYILHRRLFQRLYVLPNDLLPIYKTNETRGKIIVKKNDSLAMKLEIADFSQNKSVLEFFISYLKENIYSPKPIEKTDTTYYKNLSYEKPNIFKKDDIELYFIPNTFYDTVRMYYRKLPPQPHSFSSWHIVGSTLIPIQNYYTLKIKAIGLPERLWSKAIIANGCSKGNMSSCGGNWDNGYVKTQVRSFGSFFITIDTIPPSIRPLNIRPGANLSNASNIMVKIYDNLSGIRNYCGTIDGEWVLMEYDTKSHLITYWFDHDIKPGQHLFKLIVTDNKDNSSKIEYKFYR